MTEITNYDDQYYLGGMEQPLLADDYARREGGEPTVYDDEKGSPSNNGETDGHDDHIRWVNDGESNVDHRENGRFSREATGQDSPGPVPLQPAAGATVMEQPAASNSFTGFEIKFYSPTERSVLLERLSGGMPSMFRDARPQDSVAQSRIIVSQWSRPVVETFSPPLSSSFTTHTDSALFRTHCVTKHQIYGFVTYDSALRCTIVTFNRASMDMCPPVRRNVVKSEDFQIFLLSQVGTFLAERHYVDVATVWQKYIVNRLSAWCAKLLDQQPVAKVRGSDDIIDVSRHPIAVRWLEELRDIDPDDATDPRSAKIFNHMGRVVLTTTADATWSLLFAGIDVMFSIQYPPLVLQPMPYQSTTLDGPRPRVVPVGSDLTVPRPPPWGHVGLDRSSTPLPEQWPPVFTTDGIVMDVGSPARSPPPSTEFASDGSDRDADGHRDREKSNTSFGGQKRAKTPEPCTNDQVDSLRQRKATHWANVCVQTQQMLNQQQRYHTFDGMSVTVDESVVGTDLAGHVDSLSRLMGNVLALDRGTVRSTGPTRLLDQTINPANWLWWLDPGLVAHHRGRLYSILREVFVRVENTPNQQRRGGRGQRRKPVDHRYRMDLKKALSPVEIVFAMLSVQRHLGSASLLEPLTDGRLWFYPSGRVVEQHEQRVTETLDRVWDVQSIDAMVLDEDVFRLLYNVFKLRYVDKRQPSPVRDVALESNDILPTENTISKQTHTPGGNEERFPFKLG